MTSIKSVTAELTGFRTENNSTSVENPIGVLEIVS